MKEFKQNDKIELKVGGNITIKRKLGEGGQGIVYLVEMNGKQYALKWYTHDCTKDFYDNLDNNIKNGAPTDSFLWPQFLTVWKEKRFGYISWHYAPSSIKISLISFWQKFVSQVFRQ